MLFCFFIILPLCFLSLTLSSATDFPPDHTPLDSPIPFSRTFSPRFSSPPHSPHLTHPSITGIRQLYPFPLPRSLPSSATCRSSRRSCCRAAWSSGARWSSNYGGFQRRWRLWTVAACQFWCELMNGRVRVWKMVECLIECLDFEMKWFLITVCLFFLCFYFWWW